MVNQSLLFYNLNVKIMDQMLTSTAIYSYFFGPADLFGGRSRKGRAFSCNLF